MIIEIMGMDPYRVGKISRLLQPKLDRFNELKDIPILFSGSETSLFHDGVDQNTWVVIIKLHLEQRLLSFASTLQNMLIQILKEDAIHLHFYVFPIQSENFSVHMNEEYPPYVEEQEDTEMDSSPEQDIFLGNAFEKHQDTLDEKEAEANPFSVTEDEEPHKH